MNIRQASDNIPVPVGRGTRESEDSRELVPRFASSYEVAFKGFSMNILQDKTLVLTYNDQVTGMILWSEEFKTEMYLDIFNSVKQSLDYRDYHFLCSRLHQIDLLRMEWAGFQKKAREQYSRLNHKGKSLRSKLAWCIQHLFECWYAGKHCLD